MNKEDKVLLLFEWGPYRNQVREYLREQGYSKMWGFKKPEIAIDEARSYQPDLVLIDKNYKDSQGIAERIRARTNPNKNIVIKAIDSKPISIYGILGDSLAKRLQEAETV